MTAETLTAHTRAPITTAADDLYAPRLTRADLAQWWGVGPRTIDKHVKRGWLAPPCYVGGRPKWSEADARAYEDRGRRGRHSAQAERARAVVRDEVAA